MKCPACHTQLKTLPPCRGEWICVNDDCPANKKVAPIHFEFYGLTQKEINDQWELRRDD